MDTTPPPQPPGFASPRLAVQQLSAGVQGQVRALVAAATAADGVRPLNDEAMLAIARTTARQWLVPRDVGGPQAGELVGYAQHDPAFGTAQLFVHPEFRRRGIGGALLDAVLADGASGVWAFGDLAGAQALAARAGLVARRRLLIMERPLGADQQRPEPPAGITLRSFADGDEQEFLAVNAAAFAHHPEQGTFSAADLRARRAEPWWEPAGLIVATDAEGLVGFHWTKRHDASTGEVYVIGVHPRAQGLGLGSVLLDAGLAHLASAGCTRVILYVEADNPAVRLYERQGFQVTHTDTQYGRP